MNLKHVKISKLIRKDMGLKTVFAVRYKSGLFWNYMLYTLGLVGTVVSCFAYRSISYFDVVGGEHR